MFTSREIDDLCEFVVLRAAGASPDADHGVAALVAHLAERHPQAPALSPVLPLAMAAAALESMLEDEAARGAAAALWRAAAMLAAEVLALQAESPGAAPPRMSALAIRLRGGVLPS